MSSLPHLAVAEGVATVTLLQTTNEEKGSINDEKGFLPPLMANTSGDGAELTQVTALPSEGWSRKRSLDSQPEVSRSSRQMLLDFQIPIL